MERHQVRGTGRDESGDPGTPNRWRLIRDVAVFQLKLAIDGLRDFLLMPVSLVVGVADLLHIGPRAGHQFYDLLNAGRKTEGWINLFGAGERHEQLADPSGPGVDRLVEKMETLVMQEYARGGITSSAKDAVDRALDRISERRGEAAGRDVPPPPGA